ncbi:MAG: SpoIVB peptidase [Oscillospiraceae bacterium]|nr:SpoIVB peptidase [Oscillospiraceae bacterium]MDE7303314.1 SpoIVB peptidase [Oscillospiraceae bacterium]
MKNIIKIAVAMINIAIAAVLGVIIYYNKVLPNNYYITSGSELKLSEIIEAIPCTGVPVRNAVAVEAEKTGVRKAELKLLGIIPIKIVSIQEVDEPLLVPCGNPFGIKLLTDGVIAVEVSGFETDAGYRSPAADAGIKTGDVIKTVNGRKVMSNEDIEKIISESSGEPLSFNLVRDEKNLILNVKPELCSADGSYRAGLWVRDSSAGIGTITFYDPETGVFAGLGHPVCDVDTGNILPLSSGEVVDVNVNGVKRGAAGVPGELLGSFSTLSAIGSLELNCSDGLYGVMSSFSSCNEAVPLGMRQEIEAGEAFIYTTVNGNQPKMYSIVIEKIDLHDTKESKNMIIRVTDKELLEKSGGIVQGMSGSPIIQNGKLVGAVTHVFVNNPAKGYAIFADTMYECSKKVINSQAAA